MNNNVNFGEQKEVDRMALAQKRNPGCIITYGKEKTFFKKLPFTMLPFGSKVSIKLGIPVANAEISVN